MRKEGIVGGIIFLVAIVLLLRFSPDDLSLFMVGIMCVLIVIGYFLGFVKIMNFSKGFVNARDRIERSQEVQTDSPLLVILENERLFYNDILDREFLSYRRKAAKLLEDSNTIVEPIEEVLDEDFIALHTWNSLLVQIPGTLTGLGILGTFLGLVIGMDGIGFSSVTSAMSSISVMIGGIQIAFYTSIGGVVLSILFNLIYNTIWDMMMQERGLFFKEFHQYIIPKTDEQIRINEQSHQHMLLEKLEKIEEKMNQIAGILSNSKDGENK